MRTKVEIAPTVTTTGMDTQTKRYPFSLSVKFVTFHKGRRFTVRSGDRNGVSVVRTVYCPFRPTEVLVGFGL